MSAEASLTGVERYNITGDGNGLRIQPNLLRLRGLSDGWTDLNENFKMDWEFDRRWMATSR